MNNFLTDSNWGNYPYSQVIFDLATLSNSGKFIDFNSSYITVPLVLNVALTTTGGASVENAFITSLKNGYHQLINSILVEIANMQVVNLTNMSNLDINYRLLTTSSLEDAQNFLASIGFHEDTAESISYTDAVSTSGLGECNNIIRGSTFSSAGGYGATDWDYNRGRLQRQLNTSFDPVNRSGGSGGTRLHNTAVINATGKNHVVFTGATNVTHYITATIPFFIYIHLVSGSFFNKS